MHDPPVAGMSFYESISEYYSRIFPLNPDQVRFVNSAFMSHKQQSLLDVGCGTGDLAIALAGTFGRVRGIDLDRSMVEKARSKQIKNSSFAVMNMLETGKHFGASLFDGVICFGNTLVHLTDPADIAEFIRQSYHSLKDGGKLLLQIINYDRILDDGIRSLRTIRTSCFRFERVYHHRQDPPLIEFETILKAKRKSTVIRNSIHLYPLRWRELLSYLEDAGFVDVLFFGDFRRTPAGATSVILVVEASKPAL
jgi:2-polyprenyl-3-methyl-5-hydroxy-6-metoxy-1,4-benzoquinol methylase